VSAAGLRLERQDFIATARALQAAQSSIAREVAASKSAWPLIANGLQAGTSARAPIQAAAQSAALVLVPTALQEAPARALTEPAAKIAGTFRTFAQLTRRGWLMVAAALREIEAGPGSAARFARENVALYIESVYDGHFALAQIGRKLIDTYRSLGGESAFGRTLTKGAVDLLAGAYSEASVRLHPHVGVRLGS
jgi:hypothetical protein